MTTDPAAERGQGVGLVEELASGGFLVPGWRDAFEAVPRHLFIPGRVWRREAGICRVLDRQRNPDQWWRLVYSDEAVVTRVEEGADAEESYFPTSSASMPRMVALMLATLDVGSGHRVLEIGTGTGYNAALLAARLGDRDVTSVEIDPVVAGEAAANLRRAGYEPTVVAADGADGCGSRAPYDRVIATCAVHQVPYAWVEQTVPGGLIVTPWGTSFHNGVLLALRVRDDGTAAGSVVADSSFMWQRAERPPRRDPMSYIEHRDLAVDTVTSLDPRLIVDDLDASFAVGLSVTGCRWTVGYGAAESAGELTLWLYDAVGSWAAVDYQPGAVLFEVSQHGPRALWDEVCRAYRLWDSSGRPVRTRYGLTVTPEGQRVWLDPHTPEQACR